MQKIFIRLYVIKRGNKLIALEIKSGKSSVNKGLTIFNNEFKPHKLFIIGTNGIPFEEFLSMNTLDLFDV